MHELYDFKVYEKSRNQLARLAETAKYIYKSKTYPEHLEKELLDLIACLDSKLERWVIF
jgi:hypothetical protein